MPIKSPYSAVELSSDDIWSFLFNRKNREYPDDKKIFTDADSERSYTYAQLKDASIRFGKGLRSLWEWKKNDVLALYTPNCVDTPAVVFGTLWANGVVTTANSAYTADELEFQLKDSGAKALVTQYEMLPIAKEAAQRAGIPDNRIILLGDTRDKSLKHKHFSSIAELSGTSRWRRAKTNVEKDLAFLVYSSGTTGKPKGVKLSHRNITSNILQVSVVDGEGYSWKGGLDGKGDIVMGCLPFYHIYEVIVLPKFELERFCALVQKHKISVAYIVPPIVLGLGKHPIVSKYDLSSLTKVMSGAAPLTKDLVDTVHKRLKIGVKQGYGLSETSPVTHTQEWKDWQDKVGSCGKLLPNMTIKYMSAEEKELPVGEVGEIWVSGPNIFQGYLNNDAATQNAITDDGFFKTGDIGYEDKEGNMYITDRVKELIKYKGFQVPPAELEGLLLGHEKIADACVIGVYNEEQATELPRAYIVPAQGVKVGPETAEELTTWLHAKVAGHKKLRGGVRFVDEIPKSAAGKILRRLLRDKAKEEEAQTKAKL